MKTAIALAEIYKTVPEGIKNGDVLENVSTKQVIMITHENSTDQVYIGRVMLTSRDAGRVSGHFQYEMIKGTSFFTVESVQKVLPDKTLENWQLVGHITDLVASVRMPF